MVCQELQQGKHACFGVTYEGCMCFPKRAWTTEQRAQLCVMPQKLAVFHVATDPASEQETCVVFMCRSFRSGRMPVEIRVPTPRLLALLPKAGSVQHCIPRECRATQGCVGPLRRDRCRTRVQRVLRSSERRRGARCAAEAQAAQAIIERMIAHQGSTRRL